MRGAAPLQGAAPHQLPPGSRRSQARQLSQARSNSPSLTPAMNAAIPAQVQSRTGPSGSLESRTATRVPAAATSTQFELELL